jgi:hypothetical protein
MTIGYFRTINERYQLMNIFKSLFSTDKEFQESFDKQLNFEVTSEEQVEFANEAIEIFNPLMKQFGFKLLKVKITKYGTTIIWIKGKCYVDLGGNTHPLDAPSYFGIALGEFKEDYYHYSDLDCVGLWLLKAIQDNSDKVKNTPFPFGDDIQPSLIQTKHDLLKYAKSFLEGDLTQFYVARNKQWQQ